MFVPNKITKSFAFVLSVVAISLALTYAVSSAWSEPNNPPPNCPTGQPGCDAPINVSVSSQFKQGKLQIGGVYSPSNTLEIGNFNAGNPVNGFALGTLTTTGGIVVNMGNVASHSLVGLTVQKGGVTFAEPSQGYSHNDNPANPPTVYIPDMDITVGGSADGIFGIRLENNPAKPNGLFGIVGVDPATGNDILPSAFNVDIRRSKVGVKEIPTDTSATFSVNGSVEVGSGAANGAGVAGQPILCLVTATKRIGVCSGVSSASTCTCSPIN